MALVAACDVVAEDRNGINAVGSGGAEETDVSTVVEGVGLVVREMVTSMVVISVKGGAPDELAPVPKRFVIGGDEFANTMAGEEGGGENGEK